MTVCAPKGIKKVLNDAWPVAGSTGTVRNGVLSMRKVTVPVGAGIPAGVEEGVTCAVRVTGWPCICGLTSAVAVEVVGTGTTMKSYAVRLPISGELPSELELPTEPPSFPYAA